MGQRADLDAILKKADDTACRDALFLFCLERWTDDEDLAGAVSAIEARLPGFRLPFCPWPWQVRVLGGDDEPRLRLPRSLSDVLKHIDIAGKKPNNGNIVHLAASVHAARLEEIHIGWGTFGSKAVIAVAGSPNLGSLRRLGFRYFKPGASGMKAFGDSRTLAALVDLDMFGSTIDDAGITAFCAGRGLLALEALKLSYCRVGATGAAALAGATRFTALRTLSLPFNPLGDAGIAALARGAFPALEELDLVQTGATDAGMARLAEAPFVGRLTRLDVDLADAGPGLRALLGAVRSVVELSVRAHVDAEAWAALCAAAPPLVRLRVSLRAPDAPMVEAILAAPFLSGLESLSLDCTLDEATKARILACMKPEARLFA